MDLVTLELYRCILWCILFCDSEQFVNNPSDLFYDPVPGVRHWLSGVPQAFRSMKTLMSCYQSELALTPSVYPHLPKVKRSENNTVENNIFGLKQTNYM